MRNSALLSLGGMALAVMTMIYDGSDVDWLAAFIVMCTAFVVKALEDLKGDR